MSASAPIFNNRTSAIAVCEYFAAEIKGRNILLTGPTPDGIGFATAQAIIKGKPALLVLAGRSLTKHAKHALLATCADSVPDRLQSAQARLLEEAPDAKIKLLVLDLGSLDATRNAADEVLGWDLPIDVVINNAAVVRLPLFSCPPHLTQLSIS